jgi:hypothetical protein
MSVSWPVEQGSEEWLQKRLGIPTASQFHRIVTKSGALSEMRHDYRNELVAERILKRDLQRVKPTEWMRRGSEMEAEAVRHFLRHQRDTFGRRMQLDPAGFVTTDDGRIGCSPDRIIHTTSANLAKEAVEIKCPAPWTHVGYLLDGPGDNYVMQVQGQMLVGGFDLVHFYSYHPEFPPYYQICERSNRIIDLLHTRLATFLAELDAAEVALRKLIRNPQFIVKLTS